MKVDISNYFDAVVSEMDWGEIVSTVEDVILAEMPKAETEDPLRSLLDQPPLAAAPRPGPAVLDSNTIGVQQTCSLNEGHWGYERGGTSLQCIQEPYAPELHMRQAASWEEEAQCGNTIWPHNAYNQEVGCHPGQVTYNLR